MVIEDAKYIKNQNDVNTSVRATIDGKEIFVPMKSGNTDYTEILKQVADSTITIADAD